MIMKRKGKGKVIVSIWISKQLKLAATSKENTFCSNIPPLGAFD